MKINSRGKGATGEREFCKWLQENLKLDFLPQRNLDQVREGGADIIDVLPFSFEVKRCQGLDLRGWWRQVVIASSDEQIPVVAFRQNNMQWKFLISAKNIGLNKGFIQLEELEAKRWLLNIREGI